MKDNDQFLWVEKYRPHTINDCVLPDQLKKPFQKYVESKKIPNLILTGTAGVGKTTVAIAMCEEIGADYILINASLKNGIADLRVDIMGFATSMSLIGGRKVVILDEADRLTAQAQDGLKGAIEEVAENCSFIFTCNNLNKLIDPLRSRTAVINFKLTGDDKLKMAGLFHKRVLDILSKETFTDSNGQRVPLTYKPLVIADLIIKFFPDYRRILNELQHYSKSGMIDEGILSKLNETKITELVKFLKNKEFKSIRQWVGSNTDSDAILIMRHIYDGMYDIVKPESLPILVVLLGKYQDMAANVIDQEINLMSMLVEIMMECQFK